MNISAMTLTQTISLISNSSHIFSYHSPLHVFQLKKHHTH